MNPEINGNGNSSWEICAQKFVLSLCRFKTEVAKALESFVEKEDEFIKQVMLQENFCQRPFGRERSICDLPRTAWHQLTRVCCLIWMTVASWPHPGPGNASSRGSSVSFRGLFPKDVLAVSITVAFICLFHSTCFIHFSRNVPLRKHNQLNSIKIFYISAKKKWKWDYDAEKRGESYD